MWSMLQDHEVTIGKVAGACFQVGHEKAEVLERITLAELSVAMPILGILLPGTPFRHPVLPSSKALRARKHQVIAKMDNDCRPKSAL